MDLALWIIQVVLALAFLAFGGVHIFRFDALAAGPRTGWVRAVGKANLRVIGVLEMLGAIGLVLPAATGILPSLTPLAAAMLALLMVFAIAFHARRAGEGQNIALNVVLGVLSLAVAWGRFVVEPF
jgi:uncharacterized membrane protein YphA (DoxX/SURF4 family)